MMPKTDGYKTRQRILQESETLFAEKGFNGTSIDLIAKAAGVNKGLIYYHFKNKQDIMMSIFQNIITELEESVRQTVPGSVSMDNLDSLQQKIRMEIQYLENRKKILSILLMEALKADGHSDFLFRCAEIVARIELKTGNAAMVPADNQKQDLRYLLHEFFTGFMPVVAFVVMQDKWCSYFDCKKDKAMDYFLDSFARTHLKEHL
jgi:AcrR family transcriptional regulator